MTSKVRKRILWAEDNDLQFEGCKDALVTFLSRHQTEVEIVRAGTGNAVYRLLSDPSNSPDLLVVDIEMPEWNGIDTVRDLALKWPGLPKMVVSGRTQDPMFRETLLSLRDSGVIRGYYPVQPTTSWCEGILDGLTLRDPIILHISDLHFGRSHAFQGRLKLEDLMGLFFSLLAPNEKPNLIIVSGDLTDRGKTSEFHRSLVFLRKLLDFAGLGPESMVFVPGNHDVFRGEEQSSRLSKYLEFLNDFYSSTPLGLSALSNYVTLIDSEAGRLRMAPDGWPEDSLYAVHMFDEFRLAVIALNSAVLEDSRIDFGEISEKQLLGCRERLRRLRAPQADYIRLATFHHHLFPVPSFLNDGEPERVLRRQALVLRYLISQRVRLVLHGHTHYTAGYKYLPYFIDGQSANAQPIYIFGTGTLGSQDKVSSQSWFHLGLVCLKRRFSREVVECEVRPYRLSDDSLEWTRAPSLEFDLALIS